MGRRVGWGGAGQGGPPDADCHFYWHCARRVGSVHRCDCVGGHNRLGVNFVLGSPVCLCAAGCSCLQQRTAWSSSMNSKHFFRWSDYSVCVDASRWEFRCVAFSFFNQHMVYFGLSVRVSVLVGMAIWFGVIFLFRLASSFSPHLTFSSWSVIVIWAVVFDSSRFLVIVRCLEVVVRFCQSKHFFHGRGEGCFYLRIVRLASDQFVNSMLLAWV